MTDTKITIGKVKTVFTTSEPDKVLIQYEDKVTAGNGKKELIVAVSYTHLTLPTKA